MARFKIGDKVRVKSNNRVSHWPVGFEGIVTGSFNWDDGVYLNNGNGMYYEDLVLINNKKNMSKISNGFKLFTDKPTQTLKKADFINGDLELTQEGTTALLSLVLQDKKSDLVKLAEEKLEEEKDK